MKLDVYIDGACEPFNPGGTATYGLAVFDETGKELFSKCAVVGTGAGMSNNVAEYSGLLAFLTWYLRQKDRLGLQDALIHSDSQLLIRQMIGTWKVKRGWYVSYYQTCQQLIRDHHIPVTFQWIPREQNAVADRLSKKALLEAGVKLRIQPI